MDGDSQVATQELTWTEATTFLEKHVSRGLPKGRIVAFADFSITKNLFYYRYPVPDDIYTAAVDRIKLEHNVRDHGDATRLLIDKLDSAFQTRLADDCAVEDVRTMVPDSLKEDAPAQFKFIKPNSVECRVFAFVFCKRIRNDYIRLEDSKQVRALLVDIFNYGDETLNWRPARARWFFGGITYVENVRLLDPTIKRIQQAVDFVAARAVPKLEDIVD